MKTDLLRLLFLASALRLAASTDPLPVPAAPAKEEATVPAAERPAAAATRPTERLAADTAIFAAPDAKSAVVTRLKSGATVTPLTGDVPPGWRRVEVNGPFEAFVHSRDLDKGLDLRPGANVLESPRAGAPVLTVAAEQEAIQIVGVSGDWVKIRLEKPLPGYIAVGETANLPATPDRPVVAPPTRPATGVTGATAPGRPAQFAGNTTDLPRTFQGQLSAAARPIFNPNPPYDYQLTDVNGKRVAYLDMRRVLLNVRLESLAGRSVTVTGTLRNTVDGKDLVIAVETLTAK